MKAFFKSSLIFLTPILVVVFLFFISLTYLSKHVVNNSKQYYFPSNKELIFLGDSHITFGVIDSLIPSACNLSNLGEPYYYSFQKLKYILKKQNVKHIVLGFSYHNISSYYDELIDGNTSTVFPLKIFFCLDIFEKLRVLKWNKTKLFFLLREILYSAERKCSNLYPVDNKYSFSNGFENKLRNQKVIFKNVKSRVISQFFTFKDQRQSFSNKNIYYLKKIISFCKDNNLEIILLTTPLHPEYLRMVPNEFILELKKIIYENDVELINFENLKLNDSCYAQDGDHLTLKGAKMMTDSLINILKFKLE